MIPIFHPVNQLKTLKNLYNIISILNDPIKLILLSATPMYNDPTEIVFLINLLLQNDKRVKMNTKDIFNGKDLTEEGIEILSMRNETNRLEELFLKLTNNDH